MHRRLTKVSPSKFKQHFRRSHGSSCVSRADSTNSNTDSIADSGVLDGLKERKEDGSTRSSFNSSDAAGTAGTEGTKGGKTSALTKALDATSLMKKKKKRQNKGGKGKGGHGHGHDRTEGSRLAEELLREHDEERESVDCDEFLEMIKDLTFRELSSEQMELLAGPYLKHCDNDGMLDLIGLKQLMDNMGHPENDEALLYLLHEWDVENRGYAT